jgi:hypothetical protein
MIANDRIDDGPQGGQAEGGGRRPSTEEDYAALAASYEAEPIRPDEVRSIEIRPNGPPPSSEHYCAACGCPVIDHDDEGVCHALDAPERGVINDCSCPGLETDGEAST